MADAPTASDEQIRQLQDYIDQMPSLSTTVTKVMEVCNQPNTSPNDLNRVISLDPVLTGQVLKLINSAYYSLTNQVASLTRAIIMLGLNTVKNLALSTAVLGSLSKEKSQCLDMTRFWNHSLCVGVTAKALAVQQKIPLDAHEEYFVAGLLHDLGKIPLSNCFSDGYKQALELSWIQKCSLQRAEQMIFGFDHCFVGKLIAAKWKLNSLITDTLVCHHYEPDSFAKCSNMVKIVALANVYANIFEIGSAGDLYQEVVEIEDIIEVVGIPWADIRAMEDRIATEIDNAQIFLQIAGGVS